MIVGACGFGSSGSSVISDYLSEYGERVQVIDNIEFTWVSNVDGLIDLEYHIMHPHGRTSDSIYAIRRFLSLTTRCEREYEEIGKMEKGVLRKSAQKFIEQITDLTWDWYDFEKHETERKYRYLKYRIDDHLMWTTIPRREKKLGMQIKQYPMETVYFSVAPTNFYTAAQAHIKELLSAMGAKKDKIIVLDQPFSGNNPQSAFPFYEDPYAIVVDRDPRDNYVFARTKLLGRNHFMPCSDVQSFIKYYRRLRDNQPYKDKHDRILAVQFEDLVYDYENATKRVRDFLGLGENPAPRSVFDPSMSINNTQVWKRYPQFAEDIRIIEQELGDYLFDFSKYGEQEITGEMFFGKSPLHK